MRWGKTRVEVGVRVGHAWDSVQWAPGAGWGG